MGFTRYSPLTRIALGMLLLLQLAAASQDELKKQINGLKAGMLKCKNQDRYGRHPCGMNDDNADYWIKINSPLGSLCNLCKRKVEKIRKLKLNQRGYYRMNVDV